MKRLFSLILMLLLAVPLPASASDLLIAQAANFMPAMQEIIPAFEAETGLTAQATYTSTGKLYGQIVHGAPFDIFLAADTRRPEKLHTEGLAEAPFVYAEGQVVCWSKNPALGAKPWQEVVRDASVSKIAIANTESAPYGTAAMHAMQDAGIWDAAQGKLVFAQTIAQVFQYAETGAADAGFCAYSSMFTDKGKAGAFTVVDGAPTVTQAACILKSAKHMDAAKKFAAFLKTDTVAAIKSRYGYK